MQAGVLASAASLHVGGVLRRRLVVYLVWADRQLGDGGVLTGLVEWCLWGYQTRLGSRMATGDGVLRWYGRGL